jgi:PAS domain S-box-containing protein
MANSPPTLLRSVSSGLYQQRIRISYLGATMILTLLAIVGYFILDRIFFEQQQLQDVISFNRRQRTLSQQVLLLSTQLVNETDSALRHEMREEMRQYLEALESNDFGFENGIITNLDGSDVAIDENLRQLYLSDANAPHPQMHLFIDAAWGVLNVSDTALSAGNTDYRTVIATADDLLTALDFLSIQLHEMNQSNLQVVHRVELAILVSTLLALALNVFFIFKPMEKKIMKRDKAIRAEAEKQRQLVEELSYSEARYRLLIETMNEAFLIFDADNHITYANNQFYNLLGYTGAETIGKSTELLDESSIPVIAQHTERRKLGESSSYEAIFIHKEGRRVHTWISGSPIFDSRGNFQGSCVTITDITEQKRREEELRVNEARYRMLIERMSEGIMIGDANQRLTYVNEQFAHVLGYAPEELIGHMLDEFVDESSREIRAEQRTLRRKGESARYELTLVRKDRQKVFAILSGTPLMDAQGNFQGSFGVLTDITERKHSEEAVSRSESLYRQLVQNLPDTAVLMFDRDLRFTLAEGPFLGATGFSKAEVEGKTLSQVVSPEAQQLLLPTYEAVLRGEEFQIERPILNQPDIIYHAHFAPMRDVNEQIVGGMVVTRNVTEQKRAEQEIRDKERLLRLLVDNLLEIVFVKDLESRFILVNKAAVAGAGVESDKEILGKTDFDFHDRQRAEAFRADEVEIMTTGQPKLNYEETIFHKGYNEIRWLDTSKIPMRDEQGNIIGIVGINHDITQLKRNEQEIRDKERLLRTVIDNLPSYVYVKDIESRFVLANKAALPNLGVSSEADLIGKSDFDILQEGAEAFRAAEMELMTSGVPLLDSEETWVSQKTGETIWFSVNKIPLRDDKGNITGLVGINHDITQRKHMEQTLRENETMLRQLTDSIPEIFWIFDAKTQIPIFISRAYERIYGRPTEDSKQPIEKRLKFIYPDDRERFITEANQAMTTGRGIIEYRIIRTDGAIRWLRSLNSPIYDEAGNLFRIAVVTEDITERKQMEQALLEKQAFIERVTNTVPDTIYLYDLQDGSTHYLNHAITEDLGYTTADIVRMGDTFARDIMHPDDFAYQTHLFADVSHTNPNEVVENEYRMRHADGEWRWFYSRDIVFEWTSEGKPRRILGIARDITEAKRAQETVKRSEQLLRAVIDNVPSLVYVKDTESRFLLGNRAIIQQLNVQSEADIIGKSDFDLHPREFAEKYRADELKVLNTGKPLLDYEERVIHFETNTESWYSSNKLPMFDSDGKVIGLIGINHDVTERRSMQQAMSESLEFIGRITRAIPDTIYIYDLARESVSYINDPLPHILGYGSQAIVELGNDFLRAVMHPTDFARQMAMFNNASPDEDKVFEDEYRVRNADGEWRWFFGRYVIFDWTEDGNPLQVLSTARDITEHKKNQAMALELEGEKQRVQVLANFIRDTSHDFRTPITIIATGLETIPLIKDDEKRREKVTRIRGYVDYLVKLLNQLQRMAELDTTTQVEMHPADINTMVQDLAMNLKQSAEKKGLTLRTELDANLSLVPVNAGTLQEAVDHLMVNAILFTQTGGNVTARTYTRDDNLVIEVEDTGIGISDDNRVHIFDRFYKADQSRGLTTGGAGMGLSIVKRVVELHQGTIEVESIIDQGSIFRLVIPLSAEIVPQG